MTVVVRKNAWICVKVFTGFIAGAVLTGCALPSGQSSLTAPGFYVSASAGVAQIDTDTLNETLEVDDDTTLSVQLGLGYQLNSAVAFEVRAADLDAVEFTDGREITYQVADASGLLMRRRGNASVFGRLGVGTFNNDGDFDVELENPVHAIIGGGVAYHLLPNLDVRLSVSAHGSDAVVGNAGLVWRFGAQQSNAPRIVTRPSVENDGFEPIAPVAQDNANTQSSTQSSTQSNTQAAITQPEITQPATVGNNTDSSNSGLVIDEKPIPTLQSYPEPVVPNDVATTIREESGITSAQAPLITSAPAPLTALTPEPAAVPVPAPTAVPAPAPTAVPAPAPDPIAVAESPVEDLFVVDTLLPVGPLQFGQGLATLQSASVSELEEVIALLKENPTLRLQVESHAAPVGNADLNMLLSRRRALTVIRLLVEQGIEATRLRPRAFGDTAPIANAETINDNDRVELRIR